MSAMSQPFHAVIQSVDIDPLEPGILPMSCLSAPTLALFCSALAAAVRWPRLLPFPCLAAVVAAHRPLRSFASLCLYAQLRVIERLRALTSANKKSARNFLYQTHEDHIDTLYHSSHPSI